MNNWKDDVIVLLIVLAIFALCILFYKWIFNMVMATGWPDWVKYLILRG